MTVVSADQYHPQLASLLVDPEGEIAVVGQLGAELQALLPKTGLGLGDGLDYPFKHFYTQVSECLESEIGPPQGSRVFLTIDAGSIENLSSQLGAICQRYPNQVLIEFQHEPADKIVAQTVNQLCMASGFRFALHAVSDATEYHLYEYRLKNYKQAPDWLNARFWAHPERFNAG